MTGALEPLRESGWVRLEGKSPGEFEALAASLGSVIYETDIKLVPGQNQFAFRPEPFPLHMDGADADYVCWHVIDADEGSCPMLLADTSAYLRGMGTETRDALARVATTYQDVPNQRLSETPLLQLSRRGRLFANYFPTNFRAIRPRDAAESRLLAQFERALKSLPRIAVPLGDGDVVIVDNHRMLHGRNAMRSDSSRHLRRLWICAGEPVAPPHGALVSHA